MISPNRELKHKAVSHRARGRKHHENTLSSVKKALTSGFKYVEVDVRFSGDEVPYLFHDASFKIGRKKYIFSKSKNKGLKKFRYKKTNEKLTKLEDVLVWWKKNTEDQILCIDIKDFGFSEQILDLIEQYSLKEKIHIYSWVPHVILEVDTELRKREYSIPLFFIHSNTEAISTRTMSTILNWMRKRLILGRVLFCSDKNWNKDLGKYAHGYHHIAYLQRLPEKMVEILRYHKGGVGLPLHVDTHQYKYAKDRGLKVSIFGLWFGQITTIVNTQQYNFLAGKKDVDFVFCDTFLK